MDAVPKIDKPQPRRETVKREANELNIGRTLRDDDAFRKGQMLAFDTFSGRIMLKYAVPRPDFPPPVTFVEREWADTDATHMMEWLQAKGWKKPSIERIERAVMAEARRNEYSSAKAMLDALPPWDGWARLSNLWIDICRPEIEGDSHRAYLEAIARASIIGMVARIMEPGCKLDTMILLEGEQGILKSTLLRVVLMDHDEWFSDSMPPLANSFKDAQQHLPGKLLIEMSELRQFKGARAETLKAFLSTQADRYRPSYGRHDQMHKRQCVFFGSTNERTYFTDATGNRRFWPIACTSIDIDTAREIMPQVWAEAYDAYRKGERWWIDNSVLKEAEEQQRQRLASDLWEDGIEERVHQKQVTAEDSGESEVRVTKEEFIRWATEICKDVPVRLDEMTDRRMGMIMSKLGFFYYDGRRGNRDGSKRGGRYYRRNVMAK